MPSWANRVASVVLRGAASSSHIQRASSAGTQWIVPRIGHVRTTSRSCTACSTWARVSPERTPRDHAPLA